MDLSADTVFEISFPFPRFYSRRFLDFIPLVPIPRFQYLITIFYILSFCRSYSRFRSLFRLFSDVVPLLTSYSRQFHSTMTDSIRCYHYSSFHSLLPFLLIPIGNILSFLGLKHHSSVSNMSLTLFLRVYAEVCIILGFKYHSSVSYLFLTALLFSQSVIVYQIFFVRLVLLSF